MGVKSICYFILWARNEKFKNQCLSKHKHKATNLTDSELKFSVKVAENHPVHCTPQSMFYFMEFVEKNILHMKIFICLIDCWSQSAETSCHLLESELCPGPESQVFVVVWAPWCRSSSGLLLLITLQGHH